jgi:ribosomal protein L11 methyltransferase
VHRIGERVVIVPSWETYAAQPGDVVLDLDPGRAFGTGLHASTKLCLMAAERLVAEGLAVARFLDVGCGSGILSIAAAKLWSGSTGVAVDNDPIAVGAAAENCERNGVAVTAQEGLPDGDFALVFANIQADVLVELQGRIVARVAEGGALVLSGLLSPQAEGVAAAYAPLAVERIDSLEDWSSVVLRKRA